MLQLLFQLQLIFLYFGDSSTKSTKMIDWRTKQLLWWNKVNFGDEKTGKHQENNLNSHKENTVTSGVQV